MDMKLKRSIVKMGAVGPDDWEGVNAIGALIFTSILMAFFGLPLLSLGILGSFYNGWAKVHPVIVVLCVMVILILAVIGSVVGDSISNNYTRSRINANFARKYRTVDMMSDEEIDAEIKNGQPSG